MGMPLEKDKYEKWLKAVILSNLYKENKDKNPELSQKIVNLINNDCSNSVNEKYLQDKSETFLVGGIKNHTEEAALDKVYQRVLISISQDLGLNLITTINKNYIPQKNDLVLMAKELAGNVPNSTETELGKTRINHIFKNMTEYNEVVAGVVLHLKEVQQINLNETRELIDIVQNGKYSNGYNRENVGNSTLLFSTSNIENVPPSLMVRLTSIEVKLGSIHIPNIEKIREGSINLAKKIPKNQLN